MNYGEKQPVNSYWSKRFAEQKKRQLFKTKSYYQEIEKVYRQAINDCDMEISTWYHRLAKSEDVTFERAMELLSNDELEEFKWDVDEYIKRGREFRDFDKWGRELENASSKFHINRYEALKIRMQQQLEELTDRKLKIFRKSMKEVYEDSFYKSAFEVSKGIGIGKSVGVIDDNFIETVLDTPWAVDGRNFSDRIWTDKAKLMNTLDNELRVGLIRGDDLNTITANVASEMEVSLKRAEALVETEAAAFYSQANIKSFNDLDIEEYQNDAVLDTKTSEKCREMDGTVFKTSDYKIGSTAPPYHVRCRTDIIPYYNDEFTADETRIAKGFDGEAYEIPGDMTYNEWYNKYIKPKIELIQKIKDLGIVGTVNIPSKNINVEMLTFDTQHINVEHGRNITHQEAKHYIETSTVSITRWKGDFENYYSPDGAAFVNLKDGEIRTAFSSNDYSDRVYKMLEEIKEYERK